MVIFQTTNTMRTRWILICMCTLQIQNREREKTREKENTRELWRKANSNSNKKFCTFLFFAFFFRNLKLIIFMSEDEHVYSFPSDKLIIAIEYSVVSILCIIQIVFIIKNQFVLKFPMCRIGKIQRTFRTKNFLFDAEEESQLTKPLVINVVAFRICSICFACAGRSLESWTYWSTLLCCYCTTMESAVQSQPTSWRWLQTFPAL